MKCARLRLHERSKPRASGGSVPDRPRRFCQKRMVDPAHDEDPRWTDLLDRFHCNPSTDAVSTVDIIQSQTDVDLFLSVQNIKFDGDVNDRKRPKTCFKYKAIRNGKQHRMFVKQIVEEKEEFIEDCSSQLTCYYFDDYVKYINPEHSVPSEKSSMLICAYANNKENKAAIAKSKQGSDLKKFTQTNVEPQTNYTVKETKAVKEQPPDLESQDTKIAYHKSGKRKCLTISRTQSPETVQVIRVDVVCHPRAADVAAPATACKQTHPDPHAEHSKLINNINMKTNHFTNRYLLTNTRKTLDENVSGGAKVTLLCKTFRLSSRTKSNSEKSCVRNNMQK